MGILNQIQQMMGESQCEPENFTGRIIFMSMFNDFVWDAGGNDELCENNSKTIIKSMLKYFLAVIGLSWDDGKPHGSWNRTAVKMLQSFAGSGHPIPNCHLRQSAQSLRSSSGHD